MLFYQIGELFQSIAVGKSRRNISALMDIRPDYANVEVDGKLEKVDPDEVAVGTEITVNPGEKNSDRRHCYKRWHIAQYKCFNRWEPAAKCQNGAMRL